MFDRWRRLGPGSGLSCAGLLCAGLLSAAFALSASSARAGLVITEVMYKPLSATPFTWVEVYNAGPGAIVLDDYLLEDEFGNLTFFYDLPPSPSVSLTPGRFALLFDVGSSDPSFIPTIESAFRDNWDVDANALLIPVRAFFPPFIGNELQLGEWFSSGIQPRGQPVANFRPPSGPAPVTGQSVYRTNTANLAEDPIWALSTTGVGGISGTSTGGGEGGLGSPGFFNNSVVPEPSSLAIFLSIGWLGLSRPRRRDRNR